MTEPSTIDWIPSYVSEETRTKIVEMTIESEPEVSAVECSENLIRHWCETVEDGNPLYLDEEYARSRGFRGLVAQPGMLVCTLTLPYRWPWPPKDYKAQPSIHFRLKQLLGLPVGILAHNEMEYIKYVEVGDRLSSTSKLAHMSPWKKTRLGEGHFWTIEQTFRNQDDEVVCFNRRELFAYGRGSSPVKGATNDDAGRMAQRDGTVPTG